MISDFERWFKYAIKAQRVHQDVVDETESDSVALNGRINGYTLTKELQRTAQRELAQSLSHAPNAPGPSTPGLGSKGNMSTPGMTKTMQPKPPTTHSDS